MTRPPAKGEESLDIVALTRGASAGFTVLLVGELVGPFVGRVSTQLSFFWLSVVGALGFVVAGIRIGTALRPWWQGALAAEAAFALTVPLRLIIGIHGVNAWYAVAVSAGFALVVGALAGRAAGAARDRGLGTSRKDQAPIKAHKPVLATDKNEPRAARPPAPQHVVDRRSRAQRRGKRR